MTEKICISKQAQPEPSENSQKRRRTVECVNEETGEIEYKLRKQEEENYIWSEKIWVKI